MLNLCPNFHAKPLDEKWDLVLTEDLCWICLRGRHADGQVCFLAQWLANNKKQPCGFMGCSEDHSLVLHPPPQRALVNVLWTVSRGGKCHFCGHQNDPKVIGEGDDCGLCSNGEGGGYLGLDLLFGDSSVSVEAEKEKTGAAMTSTDCDLDLDPRRDLDIDMTEMDMDSGTETALKGAVRAVQGSQVKLTFRSPGRRTGERAFITRSQWPPRG